MGGWRESDWRGWLLMRFIGKRRVKWSPEQRSREALVVLVVVMVVVVGSRGVCWGQVKLSLLLDMLRACVLLWVVLVVVLRCFSVWLSLSLRLSACLSVCASFFFTHIYTEKWKIWKNKFLSLPSDFTKLCACASREFPEGWEKCVNTNDISTRSKDFLKVFLNKWKKKRKYCNKTGWGRPARVCQCWLV